MLEIYNEEYKDLLGKGPPAGKKHQVTVAALQVQADKHGLTWGPAMTGGRHGGSCTAEVLSCLRVSLRAASVPQAMLHFDRGCPDPWLCVAAAFMHHDNAWADSGPAELFCFCLTGVPGCTMLHHRQSPKESGSEAAKRHAVALASEHHCDLPCRCHTTTRAAPASPSWRGWT